MDGTIQTATHTLSTYVATLNADLDSRVKAAIQDAYDKISLMGEPFAYTCGAAEYDKLQCDERYLRRGEDVVAGQPLKIEQKKKRKVNDEKDLFLCNPWSRSEPDGL